MYLIIIESKTNDFPQTIPFLVYAHSVSEHVHAKRMKKQKEGEWGVRGDYRHATSRRLEWCSTLYQIFTLYFIFYDFPSYPALVLWSLFRVIWCCFWFAGWRKGHWKGMIKAIFYSLVSSSSNRDNIKIKLYPYRIDGDIYYMFYQFSNIYIQDMEDDTKNSTIYRKYVGKYYYIFTKTPLKEPKYSIRCAMRCID